MSPADARRALEAFTSRNPDLARLEDILSQFNLFEAVGIVRHELRHSNLLAFLLDPSQNHGLGDAFLKQFLQEVSPDDFDGWNFAVIDVRREWRNIDILLIDDSRRFVLLIENKIDTGERPGQLRRYYESVQGEWPDYDLLALYLTPGGGNPSHPDYLAVDYGVVCRAVEAVTQTLRNSLDPGVSLLLTHYAQMLKRHIMTDTEVADLCRTIYQKHQVALDLIFEHRLDQQSQVGDYVRSLILEHKQQMTIHGEGKSYVNFVLSEWDDTPIHRNGAADRSWVPYFCFRNHPNSLTVGLWVGPGDDVKREKLLDLVQKKGFNGAWTSKLHKSYSALTAFPILSASDYDKTQEEIEALISERWAAFLRDELPRITQAIRGEEWLWTTP